MGFQMYIKQFQFCSEHWRRLSAAIKFYSQQGMALDVFHKWYAEDTRKRNASAHYIAIIESLTKLQEIFVRLDKNQDGLLDFKEFRSLRLLTHYIKKAEAFTMGD